MSHPFRSYALISRQQIAENYRAIRRAAGPGVEVAGVVKADGYGHGAVEVSRVLEAEGVRWLAVATAAEGVELREAGIAARILVMGGCLPFEREAVVRHHLTPALPDLASIADMEAMARDSGRRLPYHLKIDSGMGRLGTRATAEAIAAAVRAAPHAELEGLMTHYASAGDFTTTQTLEQTARFAEICEALRAGGMAPQWTHMAASGAVCYPRGCGNGNLVRVGLALYGYLPAARGEAPPPTIEVRPALAWKARVVTVKNVPAGAALSYGATYIAERPMRVAVVAAGYADGVFRCLSNRGSVIAAGEVVPILGTVCMDTVIVDVSHALELQAGDEVTLLGSEGGATLDAGHIAETAGTIPYDVLCRIGRRVERLYR